jgi:EAL and modified HD-GYP domain-containing signal transduction protein
MRAGGLPSRGQMTPESDRRREERAAAGKMDESALALVARQPIYDAGMAVVGYELLYRGSTEASKAEIIDPRHATLSVIANALEIGLDRLTAGLPIHVNFPHELLVSDSPLPLPPDRVVVEVLETVPAEPQVLERLAQLRKRGHRIALDDYAPGVTGAGLLDVADIVKIVITGRSREQLTQIVRQLKERRLRLIAEEVETVEQFEMCTELGFEEFQGYVLQHPQTFRAHRVPTSRLGMLRLVAALNREVDSLEEIERLISQDVSMPYRVLRCINSSYYNLPRRIDSIHQAIVILGLDNLRRLCTLVALQAFDERPPSLFVNALVRARMCEQLGRLAGAKDPGPYFITGLFSLLDVLTGMSIQELINELPLTPAVERALLGEEGELGAALACVRAYERGAWQKVAFGDLAQNLIRASYVDSVFWAEEARTLVTT